MAPAGPIYAPPSRQVSVPVRAAYAAPARTAFNVQCSGSPMVQPRQPLPVEVDPLASPRTTWWQISPELASPRSPWREWREAEVGSRDGHIQRDAAEAGATLTPKQGRRSDFFQGVDEMPSAVDLDPQENQQPANGYTPQLGDPAGETPLRKGISALRAERERQRLKADQLRAEEKMMMQREAERRQAQAERLRVEAEKQRAEGRRSRQETEGRKSELKERLAEELRQAWEEKRRVKEQEASEVERKRVEAQKAREESERRRSQGRQKVAAEKQKMAEEARRIAEENRRRRTAAPQPSSPRGGAQTPRQAPQRSPRGAAVGLTPREASPASPRSFLRSQGVAGKRGKEGVGVRPSSASPESSGQQVQAPDKRKRAEAERRKAEEEQRRSEEERRQQAEKEEARQRGKIEELRSKAAESTDRIAAAGVEWHRVLGVEPTASLTEVKQAFRELALLHHPDKGLESCDDTFRLVRSAYQRALSAVREGQSGGSQAGATSPTVPTRPAGAATH